MNRQLTARSSLETLRKEAKRWLKALRAHDAAAWERLRHAYPDVPAEPGLRHLQHALAREHGFASWSRLKMELEAIAAARSGREKLLAEFLEHSCIHYGVRPGTGTWDRSYRDEPARWQYAARILARHPDLAQASIHAAAVSGNLAQVERILSERPGAVHEKGGPQGWEPLLYVCYGRLPVPEVSQHSVEIARKLLDTAASLSVRLEAGEFEFRPLTGAIGEGEFSQPRHPQAAALAELLIERGADPYDPQALYNTSLEGDDVFWLDFLYERSARMGQSGKWSAESTGWPSSGMLNYLLGNAVTRSALNRAAWLLARGADPNTRHAYTKRKVHTEARLLGFVAMADLLRSAGAVPEALQGVEEFLGFCMQSDLDNMAALARRHPQYLTHPAPLLQAAERDLIDVARLLLDLGMSPDIHDENQFRPLHAAAATDAVRVASLLIERGAAIDPQEARFHGTPLGWALFFGRQRMIELLGPLSRSPKSLVRWGDPERLREIFAADASLAKTVDDNGSLFAYLPDDEDRATQVAELLLQCGADPLSKDKEGLDAIQQLDKRGLEDVAELLRSACSQREGRIL